MSRFEKWNLWLTAALTTVSGLGLLWTKYFLHPADPWAVINHPLQPWFLKAHIVTAPLLVFAIGLVTTRHIWHHLRTRVQRARRSGMITVAVVLPMVVSGYLIQVVTHTGWVRTLALSHIALGLIFAAALLVHGVVVAPSRRSGDATMSQHRRRSARGEPGSSALADPEIFAGRGQ